MQNAQVRKSAEEVTKFADMFSAMGTEARLRIMQLLLTAHPEGMVVGEIQKELEIPNSTLSHHLDKLRNENLVKVQRESTFLRYTANTEALQELKVGCVIDLSSANCQACGEWNMRRLAKRYASIIIPIGRPIRVRQS